MKRLSALFCAFFLMASFTFANDDSNIDDEEEVPSPKTTTFRYNEPGDQFMKIDLIVTCPLNFGGSFPLYRGGKLSTGGAGSLGYNRFITSWFALGVNVRFGYHPTIGENVFTYIPFILSATFQPTYGRFEFPITIGVGAAMENYLNRTYFPGFILNPHAGVFYRVSPSWSFGVEGDFMYMPQWYSDSKYNDYGNFGSVAVSARYHF